MTTEQTAQQLELAAQILRTGHPFEVRHDASDRWHASLDVNPAQAVLQDWHLRPTLATPPDNRPLHNPDNLTAEAVGVGYRLTVEGEPPHEDAKVWLSYYGKWCDRETTGPYIKHHAYRLPISVPWPEPAFQLPPCAPGMRWHREGGWKADDLPQGYRPHIAGEESGNGTQQKYSTGWVRLHNSVIADTEQNPMRTTRPLTFEHAGKTWTYHRPGDPMPCDGDSSVNILCRDDQCFAPSRSLLAKNVNWDECYLDGFDVLGWRYADEKKTVPLGREDVPPGSVLSLKPPRWFVISGVCDDGVYILDDEPLVESLWKWHYLAEKAQINRSIPLTGKWNPDAWEPCSKEIPA